MRWDRDARGLIAGETYTQGATLTRRDYGYDGRGALTTATTGGDVARYGYTASGLPDTISDAAGARAVHRSSDRLTVGGVGYTWDALGRVVGDGDWTFSYGASGQLARASRAGRQIDFVYDDNDQRLLKRVDGVPVRASVAGGVLTEDHFVELVIIGGVVAGVLDNGRFTALLTDPRGTPFAGPDGTPGLASPYGVRTAHLGLAEVIDYARLGWDPDLGIVRMGVRDYDPRLSQFLTPDPLYLEDLEKCRASPLQCALYGYAGGNPLRFVDPTGTDWLDWVADGVGAVIGGFDAVSGGLYSRVAFSASDRAVFNNTIPHFKAFHAGGEFATSAVLMATGVGELSTAVRAGSAIVILSNGERMVVAGVAVSSAILGGGELTLGAMGAKQMLSEIKDDAAGGDGCQCSKAGGGGSTAGTRTKTVDELRQAARAPDKGDLSAAGRALQKHGGRPGSAYPAAKGPPAEINKAGEAVVDEILTNKASTTTTRHHARFGDVIEVRAPDGRGVRYDAGGKLIGFLEP